MAVPIFLSYPKPNCPEQQTFIECVSQHLRDRGMETKTLGQTEYDMNAPLAAVRRMMLESNGVMVVAFRRHLVEKGATKHYIPDSKESPLDGHWLTSPWCQIEPAMAFQLGLPLLILREKGVVPEGVLQHGVTGSYMPEFDLVKPCDEYMKSEEWRQLVAQRESKVRSVRDLKGQPPVLGR